MSKAEDKLLDKARKFSLNYTTSLERSGKVLSGFDLDMAYLKGYHQAEKDNELTWEDIPKIFQISEELKTSWWFRDNEQTELIGTQVFWEEVLKRFKAMKENN